MLVSFSVSPPIIQRQLRNNSLGSSVITIRFHYTFYILYILLYKYFFFFCLFYIYLNVGSFCFVLLRSCAGCRRTGNEATRACAIHRIALHVRVVLQRPQWKQIKFDSWYKVDTKLIQSWYSVDTMAETHQNEWRSFNDRKSLLSIPFVRKGQGSIPFVLARSWLSTTALRPY